MLEQLCRRNSPIFPPLIGATLERESFRNRTPHGTATALKGVFVPDDDALLLCSGKGNVDAPGVEHEARESITNVAAADGGNNHHVRV